VPRGGYPQAVDVRPGQVAAHSVQRRNRLQKDVYPLATPLGATGSSNSTFEMAGVDGIHGLKIANHEIVELNPENLLPFS
jgi:hypothetical protein